VVRKQRNRRMKNRKIRSRKDYGRKTRMIRRIRRAGCLSEE
jgi:hypothetical protein